MNIWFGSNGLNGAVAFRVILASFWITLSGIVVLLLLELSVLSFLLSLTMVISLRILASCAVIFISSVLFNVDTIANEMFEVKNSTDGRT